MPVQIKEATVAGAARDGSDIYLHLQAKRAGKIKGEAISTGHEGDIVVRSWQWALNSAPGVGSIMASGRRTYTGLTLVKPIDTATTGLMSALATNDEIKEAKLTMRKSGEGQLDYFIVTLNAARISQVEHAIDATGAAQETITLLFHKVEVEYRPQTAAGARGGAFVFNDDITPGP